MLFLSEHTSDNYGGTCVLDKQAPRPYGHTDMARHFPTFPPSLSPPPLVSSSSTYFVATSITLLNGDICHLGDWVLFSLVADSIEPPGLGRIREIVVSINVTRTQQYPRPDAILLQQADVAGCVGPY